MQARSGLAVGFAVIVVATSIISGASEEKPAPPADASITANLTGDPGWHFNSTEHILVAVDGKPPTEPTTLVDATGLHHAVVESAPGECEDLGDDVRTTGLGTDEWCLKVTGLDIGAEITGTVTSTDAEGGTKLTLKVTERYHFFALPFLFIFLGLFAAIVWTWAIERGLPALIPLSKLWRELGKNEEGGTEKIKGLRAWSRQPSIATATALAAIKAIMSTCIPNAEKARRTLAAALERSTLPSGHALREEARVEATRTDHDVHDFYDDEGKPVEEHPATKHTKVLERAERLLQRLSRAEVDTDTRVPDALRPDLRARANSVRARLLEATNSDLLEEASRQVDLLEVVVFESIRAQRSDRIRSLTDRLASESLEDIARGIGPVAPPRAAVLGLGLQPSSWTPPAAISAFAASPLMLGLLALIQIVVAIYTVATGVYAPNHTFGTGPDWLALLAAAYASSAATGIVGLAALGEAKKD